MNFGFGFSAVVAPVVSQHMFLQTLTTTTKGNALAQWLCEYYYDWQYIPTSLNAATTVEETVDLFLKEEAQHKWAAEAAEKLKKFLETGV